MPHQAPLLPKQHEEWHLAIAPGATLLFTDAFLYTEIFVYRSLSLHGNVADQCVQALSSLLLFGADSAFGVQEEEEGTDKLGGCHNPECGGVAKVLAHHAPQEHAKADT